MRYIAWVLKLAVFVLLLTLAMQNGEIVRLALLPGVAWDAPLILFKEVKMKFSLGTEVF